MHRIKLKKVNGEEVKAMSVRTEDKRPVLGGSICPTCYTNMALIAPTAGGKTTTLAHILKKCAGKKTKIVAFVSTLLNDEMWLEIKRYFKSKKIEFHGYTSLFEDGKNLLADYIEEYKKEAKEREEKEEKQGELMTLEESVKDESLFFGEDEEEKEEKEKYQYPKTIFVFDDLSDELRSQEYQTFLRSARHWNITTITCTQDLKDIRGSGTRNQIRIWLLFKNLNEERLRNLYETIAPNISLDKFEAMYKHAVSKPYSFLYLSPRTGEYRLGFSHRFEI